MSKKLKFNEKEYNIYNLNNSFRFVIEEELKIEEGDYSTYPMAFIMDISKEMAVEFEENKLEVDDIGFDGDSETAGELIMQISYKDKVLSYVKIWMEICKNERIDIDGVQVINDGGKYTLNIFVTFSCVHPDFSKYIESVMDGEIDEFVNEFYDFYDDDDDYDDDDYDDDDYDDDDYDDENPFTFIEDGIEKVKVVGLSNIKYGNMYGSTYTFASEEKNFLLGDIVYNKEKGDVYLVTTPSEVIPAEDCNCGGVALLRAGTLFESKKESDKELLKNISFRNGKATPLTKKTTVYKQSVDLEKLADSLTSEETIILVGVTVGSGKKIYYVASSGFDIKLKEQVMCGKEKDEFTGKVKELPKEFKISEIPMPLSRLYYIRSKSNNASNVSLVKQVKPEIKKELDNKIPANNYTNTSISKKSDVSVSQVTAFGFESDIKFEDVSRYNLNILEDELKKLENKTKKYCKISKRKNDYIITEISKDIPITTFAVPRGVTKIIYPLGLTSGIHNIEKLILPDTLTYTNVCAFSGLKIESVILPESITFLGNKTFSDCTNLKEVIIKSEVQTIPYGFFKRCFSLKSVIFPESIKKIADYAFVLCKSLENIVIPNTILEIGDGAFSNCSNLKNVVISNQVSKIGYETFSDCINLKKIYIPSSVISIDRDAFKGVPNLTVYTDALKMPIKWFFEIDQVNVVYGYNISYR